MAGLPVGDVGIRVAKRRVFVDVTATGRDRRRAGRRRTEIISVGERESRTSPFSLGFEVAPTNSR